MQLYLVQHAQAAAKEENPERPLTAAGAEATETMARWLGRIGVRVAEIRHSGKTRAEQTAQILATRLPGPPRLVVGSGLAPKDDVKRLTEELSRREDSLMVVGHLPYLGRLAGTLIVGDPACDVVQFRQAGVVCLARVEDRWRIDWVCTPEIATRSLKGPS